jgi:phosphate transport system substrate-binding protein
MSRKNETPVLIGSLLITAGLLGGGYWFLSRQGFNFNQVLPTSSNSQSNSSSAGNLSGNSRGVANFRQVKSVPTGQFRYGGSTSFAPVRMSVDAALQSARPEFRLQYINPVAESPSSGNGIKMLLNRQIDVVQSSRPTNAAEQTQAKRLGVVALQEVPVAIDGIAVAVNPRLSLPGLTLDQLRGIYTGQIRNWQAVGGPNLAITPLSRPLGSGGTVDFFQETVLGGQSFGGNVQFVSTTTQALQRLGANSGAIYYASAPEVVPQCTIRPLALGRGAGQFVAPYGEPWVPAEQCPAQRNQLNAAAFQSGDYPLTRNLYIIWKQDQGRSQQAGQAYADLLLTQEGQAQLAQAGFVPLR